MNKNHNTTNESLENKVESNFISRGIRKLKNAVLGLTLAGAVASCATPGYSGPATEATRKRTNDITDQALGGAENASKRFNSNLKIEKNGKVIVLPGNDISFYVSPEFEKFADEENDEISSRDYITFNSLKEENKLLEQLYNDAKFKRAIIRNIKRNVDIEVYNVNELPTPVELEKIAGTVNLLVNSLYSLKKSEIETLRQKIAKKSERIGNKKMLEEFDQLLQDNNKIKDEFKSVARTAGYISHGKFYMDDIDAANDFFVALHYSQTGVNLYEEGNKVIDSLKAKKLGEVVDAESPILQSGKFSPDMTIDKFFVEIKNGVQKKAENNGRRDRHWIAQEEYFWAKNLGNQAHNYRQLISKDEESNLKSLSEFNKLNNDRAINYELSITNSLADIMKNGINEDRGVSAWTITQGAIPFVGIWKMIDCGPYALAPNKMTYTSPDGVVVELKDALYDMGLRVNGAENSKNVVHDNSDEKAGFYSGLISTTATVAGMAVGATFAITGFIGGSGTTTTSGSGTGPAFGGENGGPGTGN